MKNIGLLSCIVLFLVVISGCTNTTKETDELIQRARKEMPIAESDTIDIAYVGMYAKDGMALFWFISGNEHQAHYYLPMEYKIVGEDEYTFERSYRSMERADDIAVLQWANGYCFLINNQNCRFIRIVDKNDIINEVEIESESYPYIYYYDGQLNEYHFLDTDRNEIRNK